MQPADIAILLRQPDIVVGSPKDLPGNEQRISDDPHSDIDLGRGEQAAKARQQSAANSFFIKGIISF
jgi:hypothetical protein